MRVLLIKTSSMGDIIHTLPALTDAARIFPAITFDWVVENAFVEIPRWHPRVDRVIPVALRHWRKAVFSRETLLGLKELRKQLQTHRYDLILDAQGLAKSAFLSFFAKGIRSGLDFRSAREGLASFAYQRKYTVNFYQHAIVRMRQLFSQAFNYPLPETGLDFGIDRKQFQTPEEDHPYLVFLHGTTWTTKLWPEEYWIELAERAGRVGYRVKMSGGNAEEMARALRMAKKSSHIDLLPRLDISGMASLLAGAKAVVAVDTGLGHLAAALNVPTVSLYGPTNPEYTGALGQYSIHLATPFSCAPCMSRVCKYREPAAVTPACFGTLAPERVWEVIRGVCV